MKKNLLVAIAASAVLFTGCSQHMGNFTALSTDAYNSKNINSDHIIAKNVEKDVTSLHILLIPIGGVTKLDQAVSETAHENGGDYLKNVQVYGYGWTAILFAKAGFRIKGDVYKTQD